MNFQRTLGLLLVTSLGTLAACAGSSDDTDSAEGAATTNSINVANAPVEICGKDGKEEGCDPCPEIIGDAADKDDKSKENVTYHRVVDTQACTLKSLRHGVRDRVGALISAANLQANGGFFFPTGGTESKIAIRRITIKTAIAGARTAVFEGKRLGGSFTMGNKDDGEQSSISGGLSVFSAYMPVNIMFTFEDLENPGIFTELPMKGEYGLVPYFFMRASMDANLNLGGILSKFGGTAIGGSLLTALGGNASLQLNASETKMWKEPRCAEASLGASEDQGKGGHYATFDKDFYRNVLEPFCRVYQRSHSGVKCGQTGAPEAFNASFFEARKLHTAEACRVVSQPLFGLNETDWAFVAPKAWGYAPGQDTFLYRRTSDAMSWEREHEARVLHVDQNACGAKKPGPEEVCVHVLVKNGMGLPERIYDGADCTEAQGRSQKKDAVFGFSQDDASNTRGFIRTAEKL
jgi:hypothetical protein